MNIFFHNLSTSFNFTGLLSALLLLTSIVFYFNYAFNKKDFLSKYISHYSLFLAVVFYILQQKLMSATQHQIYFWWLATNVSLCILITPMLGMVELVANDKASAFKKVIPLLGSVFLLSSLIGYTYSNELFLSLLFIFSLILLCFTIVKRTI